MRILIVEDDKALGNLLKNYLLKAGRHEVIVLENGRDIQKLLNNKSIDCAFVDLQLPGVSGIDILKFLKFRDPTIPVIMMSGYLTLEKSLEAMRLGASDFLSKPFSFSHLMMSLERALKERQILLDNVALRLELEARKELERLNAELEKNLEYQRTLFSISKDFDDVKFSEKLYSLLVDWALKLSRGSECGFFVVVPSNSKMILMASACLEGPKKKLPDFIEFSNHFSTEPDDILSSKVAQTVGVDVNLINLWPLKIRGELFGFIVALYDDATLKKMPEGEEHLFEFLVKKSSLAIENLALYESLMANFYGILRSLVNALEAKDLYTGKHSERVTRVAVKIAKTMGRPSEEIEALNTVGYLHDIGKIGIPDGILNKPARLTNEEFEVVKKHPIIGEDIVKELGLSEIERSIIRHHHERWDGKGYPDGIGGEDIPIITRIITLADAYDAMSTDRPYRKALKRDEIIKELISTKGKQFDSKVVEAFLEILGDIDG